MKTEQELKNAIKQFRPISQKTNLFDPNIRGNSNRLYKFKDEKGNKFVIWIFPEKIKLEVPLATSLLFSVNIPDTICFANKFLENINGIGKLYTDNSKDEQVKFCVELLKEDLNSLGFDLTEGLIIYRNSLQMIVKNDRQIIPEVGICERIKSIIEINYPSEICSVDYTDLPDDLLHIVVKYEKWAISDDFEREDRIKKMTKKECVDLIETIEKKLDDINKFLNTFENKQLTEGAIALQCLAEITMELKLTKEE
jgi:hypothetical protein